MHTLRKKIQLLRSAPLRFLIDNLWKASQQSGRACKVWTGKGECGELLEAGESESAPAAVLTRGQPLPPQSRDSSFNRVDADGRTRLFVAAS